MASLDHKLTAYDRLQVRLTTERRKWLITGVAGFIGSNLLEALLKLGQRVIGMDNFSTGHQRNLDEVRSLVTPEQWSNFKFFEGDIRNLNDCRRVFLFEPGRNTNANGHPVQYVLHNAALGSVPRSIEDPITTNASNIDGFLNMLIASREAGVIRFVYAASSSTYGDDSTLSKCENRIGRPLSPYAVTKYVNELYAEVFARVYGFRTIGLRYFNVFGKRQDPDGPYAAVIPKWIAAMIRGEPVYINGDGETTRDFCYIANAIQANILAAMTTDIAALDQVYNVAVGERTSLNTLYAHLKSTIVKHLPGVAFLDPLYRDFRPGDVRHSQADVSKASTKLAYAPSHRLKDGLAEVVHWYVHMVTTYAPHVTDREALER